MQPTGRVVRDRRGLELLLERRIPADAATVRNWLTKPHHQRKWLGAAVPVTDGDSPMRIVLDDGAPVVISLAEVDGVTHVLICGSAGQATEVDAAGHTLTTDAELAVVSFRPEGPRALVVEGTHVDVDGQPVQLDEGEWVHRRGG